MNQMIAICWILMGLFLGGCSSPQIDPEEQGGTKEREQITNSIGMKLSLIPKGSFMMMSIPHDVPPEGKAPEVPHQVTLSKDYYLCTTEVTQGQYEKLMGSNPSVFQQGKVGGIDTSTHPVDQVSWKAAVEFCKQLSELPEEKKAGRVYRLPTEAEWEYACRAGTTTAYYFGDDPESLDDYGWYEKNSGRKTTIVGRGLPVTTGSQTQAVGQKLPNAFGLYDMHGNLQEWCSDWSAPYPQTAVIDPVGPETGEFRVCRDGCVNWGAESAKSAERGASAPFVGFYMIGFRVAMSVSGRVTEEPAPLDAVKPVSASRAAVAQSAWADHLGVSVASTNSIGMSFKVIPAGEFIMGDKDGATPHKVRLTKPFHLGVHEVTQAQYDTVAGTNPSYFKGSQKPVEQVSWAEAVAFCELLSALPEEKEAGRVYRLPTEAEWEFACRAGTHTDYSFGDDVKWLGDYAWASLISNTQTHPVGKLLPNPFGLFDMHANVDEWCSDWSTSYDEYPLVDPAGPGTGGSRVVRGGNYSSSDNECRSGARSSADPLHGHWFHGFRVAMNPSEIRPKKNPRTVETNATPQPKVRQEASANELGVPVETTNAIGMSFRLIPAAEFLMGSPFTGQVTGYNETPHMVTLTKPFAMGVHEVTQSQFERIMDANPSRFKGPNHPVEQVFWEDAAEFCKRLSDLPGEKAAGRVYRLPTEAEWEFACRAWTETPYSFGNNIARLEDHAWYSWNSNSQTHPVGQKEPNAFGLCDMHGNVSEWSSDLFEANPSGGAVDPVGPSDGWVHVGRGGSWSSDAIGSRSAVRSPFDAPRFNSTIGFRVALSFPRAPK